MPSWWPLSDEPTEDDQLGFQSDCERVAEGLKRCRSTGRSLTIGIYGKWGSGKTSFLKMLCKELEGSHTIIWFDAWQYSRREELWVALLRKVLAVIEKEHGKAKALRLRLQVWYDIKKKGMLPALAEALWPVAWKVVAIVLWLSAVGCLGLAVLAGGAVLGVWRWILGSTISLAPLVTVGLLGKKGLDVILGSQLGVKLDQLIGESSYASFIAFIDEFSRDFKALVREVGQEQPLVILIDDLDRCQPDEIVPVLEAIKMLTGQKRKTRDTQQNQKQAGCAFILAMDRDVVERAIEVQYKDFVQAQPDGEVNKPISGQQYLEKIVQLPIPLPPLTSINARDFIEQLVNGEEINHYRELFARGLEPTTPRQIKRVLNAFAYCRATHPELRSDLLAKLIVIQSKWRDIYNKWVTYPALLGDLESFAGVMTATELDLSHRFALPAPDGVERLVERFGRWRGLTNLLLWAGEEGGSFGSIPDPMQYLISETGGAEPMGVAQIWPSLLSGDETKVRSALQTLRVIGEQQKREEREGIKAELFALWLLDHLDSDDALKKELAVVALAEMSQPEAIDPLIEITADRDVVAKLRQRAVHALGQTWQIGSIDERTVGLLGRLLCDGNEDLTVRLIAADALSNSEVRTADLDRSTARSFLLDLFDIIEPPSDTRLYWRVLRLLGRLGNRDDKAIDGIIEWISHASLADLEWRRQVAGEILGRIEAKQLASRVVINLMEPHPEEAKILRIAGETAVRALITLAQDHGAEPVHRERAIELLGQTGNEQIVQPLIGLLKDDPSVPIRTTITMVLGRMAVPEPEDTLIAEHLVDLLKDDPSVLIRAAAAKGLGEMAARERENALQALLDDALTDPDETVRSQAAIALPRTPPSLRSLLIDALHEKTRDPEVRHVLIDTLGDIDDEEAIAALERVTADETEDKAIRLHAGQIVESLRPTSQQNP